MNRFVLLAVLPIVILCCRQQKVPVEDQAGVVLKIREAAADVELAVTAEQRSKGLMYRKHLPDNKGMLFVYAGDAMPSFWMKNTHIPLSAAFINSRGKIISIQTMEPETTERHSPPSPVHYVLEMNRGWFEKNRIEKGDMVYGLPEVFDK